jgi:hypothetical protein
MQPDSRPESALEVKSSTHELKQLSTRFPKTCCVWFESGISRDLVFLGGGGGGVGSCKERDGVVDG